MTSLGVYRRMQTLSTPDGRLNILAVDHRDAMRMALAPDDPDSVPDELLTSIKCRLVAHLASLASAVMLEPEYSMAPVVATGALPGERGFTAAIEAQGYLADPDVAVNSTLAGWSVAQAAAAGASAAKILVLWDPDDAKAQDAQTAWIEEVAGDASASGLPLLLEPIIRRDAPLSAHVQMIEHMARLGPTILKLAVPRGRVEVPADEVFTALGTAAGPHPWVLLSAGVGFEEFADQVEGACRAGASGFAVGRALWAEALTAFDDDEVFDVMTQRLRRLCDITAAEATPWMDRVPPPPTGRNWFREEQR